jgi:hypothetical protein
MRFARALLAAPTARTAWFLAVALLSGGASPVTADDRGCVALSGAPDTATYVAAGLRVVVTARNTCAEDLAGESLRFKVTVRSKNGGTAGTQKGRFSGTLRAYASAETVVLVPCEPERAGEIEVVASK